MRDTISSLFAALTWRECVGCGALGVDLCDTCATVMRGSVFRAMPRPCPVGLPMTWSGAPYDGAVRLALVAFKEHGRMGLRRPLALALSRAVGAALRSTGDLTGIVLVPVPSGRSSMQTRDTVPVQDLADTAARLVRDTGVRCVVRGWLSSTRDRRDQAGLTRADRQRNLAYSIDARDFVPRRARIVLVDDVITTGATLAECARALREVGATPLGAATVAATQLH